MCLNLSAEYNLKCLVHLYNSYLLLNEMQELLKVSPACQLISKLVGNVLSCIGTTVLTYLPIHDHRQAEHTHTHTYPQQHIHVSSVLPSQCKTRKWKAKLPANIVPLRWVAPANIASERREATRLHSVIACAQPHACHGMLGNTHDLCIEQAFSLVKFFGTRTRA